MSRPLKASLAALLIVAVSSVFLGYDSGYALKRVKAAEPQTPTQVQATDDAIHDQLRKLLLERKQILERIAEDFEVSFRHGTADMSEYGQAKKAALLAGIDLCNTKSERIEIHKEVVKLYRKLEEHDKRRVEAGMLGQRGLASVARLEAEIDLLREKLR